MTAQLDEEAVRHVATLARLRLSDEEIALFRDQLSRVLGYVAQLNELNTDDVAPTAHALALHNVFREDEVRDGLTAEDALHNAPGRRHDFFQVPRVLDQEE